MNGDVAMAVLPVLVALVVLWRGLRPLRDVDLARWQARFDATIPDSDVGFVTRRLQRSRRVRSTLVAAGLAIGGLPAYMNLIDPARSAEFANSLVGSAWLFGAAAGAVIAEVVVDQRPRRRIAALLERRPEDYVDARLVRVVMLAVPVVVALAVISTSMRSFDWWEAWVGVVAAVVAAGGVHVGLHAIADRPALDPAGPVGEVDDALRADGAHHLVGAALALAATGADAAAPSLDGAGAIPALLLTVVALLAYVWWWLLARDVRWSVRRARATA
ncbi:MAG TPA: hypothetical protein VFZ77_14890 [Acidimicrobiales bacterium]